MQIGLDFDNTIARYDEVFLEVARSAGLVSKHYQGSKQAIRDFLLSQPQGDKCWQKLQGQVYGKWMHRATLMPGLAWFLYRCRARRASLYIVSHKTEYGHFDYQRVPLRDVAIKWMETYGFFDPCGFGMKIRNVFFEDTRKNKIERIAQLELTHFVDDLQEVFDESRFPTNVEKILFLPHSSDVTNSRFSEVKRCISWAEVSRELLGPERHEEVLYGIKRTLPDSNVKGFTAIHTGGNSQVYQVSLVDGESVAFKRYPATDNDTRDRLSVEYKASKFLHRHGINCVPKCILLDRKSNIGVYEWVSGEQVLSPDKADLDKMIGFVRQLHGLRKSEEAKDLPLATEACLNGAELFRQIDSRRKSFEDVLDNHPNLRCHLIGRFDPLWTRIREYVHRNWPSKSEFSESLALEYQTLSTSDFGFHNALRENDGSLCFVDLEYFGWDDPVKLISDFWWHPAMQLGENLKEYWLHQMIEVFSEDSTLASRLNALHSAYGLRWALIVLKQYLKIASQKPIQGQAQLEIQLRKSVRLCDLTDAWLIKDIRIY